MSFDRVLLRAPFRDMREQLEQSGNPPPDVPATLAARVRARWRFDMAALGVDTTSPDQMCGALAGMALGMKSALLMAPDAPIGWYVQWVLLFETLEVILDEPEPTDEQIAAMLHDTGMDRVRTPWGEMLGYDLTGAAEALAAAQTVDRYDLADPDQLAALADIDPPAPPTLGGHHPGETD